MQNTTQVPKEFVDKLKELKSFLLVSHVGLDGDHLGSMLALQRALRSLGKEVDAYLPERVPPNYSFLHDLSQLIKEVPQRRYDAIITLECPTQRRMPKGFDPHAYADFIINFDHHPDNDMYGNVNWVVPEAASLGELTFDVIEALGVHIDLPMATALYVAILTDTGSFQYSRVNADTHRRLARLLEAGVPTDEVARLVLRQSRPEVIQMLGQILSRMTIHKAGLAGVVWAEISLEDLDRYGVKPEETQSFVDDLDRVDLADIILLFRETPDKQVKVSFRSRELSIRELAARFGGGGHSKAAGCVVPGTLTEVRTQVLAALPGGIRRHVALSPHAHFLCPYPGMPRQPIGLGPSSRDYAWRRVCGGTFWGAG